MADSDVSDPSTPTTMPCRAVLAVGGIGNGDDRAGCVRRDVHRGGAHHEVGEPTGSPGPDDNGVGVQRLLEQSLGGPPVAQHRSDVESRIDEAEHLAAVLDHPLRRPPHRVFDVEGAADDRAGRVLRGLHRMHQSKRQVAAAGQVGGVLDRCPAGVGLVHTDDHCVACHDVHGVSCSSCDCRPVSESLRRPIRGPVKAGTRRGSGLRRAGAVPWSDYLSDSCLATSGIRSQTRPRPRVLPAAVRARSTRTRA